jgi:hypothetical protein
LLTGALPFKAKAQDLVIKTKDGNRNAELLISLHDFTFSENNLLLKYLDGSTDSYSISNISTLYFRNVPVTKAEDFILKDDEGEIFVYPNPADDFIHIRNLPEGTLTLYIYSIDGVILLCKKVSSDDEFVDISYMEGGLYLVKIGCQVFKLRKQ